MGCDIHFVIERKRKETIKWLGVLSTTYSKRMGGAQTRDYDLFAELANVRGRTETGNYPKFIPHDISELALDEISIRGTDGHSHSYMKIDEFIACYQRSKGPEYKPRYEDCEYWDLFGIDTYELENFEFRIVFWFDN